MASRWSAGLVALLSISMLVLQAGSQGSSSGVPEINSSILLVGPGDIDASSGTSRCMQMVQTAAGYKQSRLMFTPTLFWVDENYQNVKSINSQENVTYYCLNRGSSGVCPAPTAAQIASFQSGMQACFQRAVDVGFTTLAVAPHLDDGLGLGGWRNGLLFDPLKKYGNYSYADVMLYPLATALANVATADTKIYMAMQGEMSATVFYFPGSYVALLPDLQARLSKGQASSGNIKLGVSTNFDKLCGCVLQDLVDPSQYLQLFPAAFAPKKSQFDLTSLSTLYNSVDFIGISAYPSLTPNFTLSQIESATQQFDLEIQNFGINVKDLIFNKGKELWWNEYGVGGGASQNGNVPAKTAAQAAATPFFGVFGAYQKARDPWQTPEVKAYNHYFYQQTLAYLDSRGTCQGCQYRVDGIFIWNDASWDVQAIYPESTTGEGTYKDPYIVSLINSHNQKSMGGSSQVSASSVAASPAAAAASPSAAISTGAGTDSSSATAFAASGPSGSSTPLSTSTPSAVPASPLSVSPSPPVSTPSPVPTPSPVSTPSPIYTPSPVYTPSPTLSPTAVQSLTPSQLTARPAAPRAYTPSPTQVPAPAATPSPAFIRSYTPSPTPAATPPATPAATPSPTAAPTPFPTPAATPSPTPGASTSTAASGPSASYSPSPSPTSGASASYQASTSPSYSPSPSPTYSPSPRSYGPFDGGPFGGGGPGGGGPGGRGPSGGGGPPCPSFICGGRRRLDEILSMLF